MLKIMDLIRDLNERINNTEDSNKDKQLGKVYIHSLAACSFESYPNEDINLELILDKVDKVVLQHNFDEDEKEYIEFIKNKIGADFYSGINSEKGLPYLQKMIDYALNKDIVYYVTSSIDQLMSYVMKCQDEAERVLPLCESKIDSLISHRSDKDNCIGLIHGGIIQALLL